MKILEKRRNLFIDIEKYVKRQGDMVAYYCEKAVRTKDKDDMKTAEDEILKNDIRKEMEKEINKLIWNNFYSNYDDMEFE